LDNPLLDYVVIALYFAVMIGAGFVARGEHDKVLVSRVTTLLVGVVTLVISLIVSDVVGALTVAFDLLTGALFVPIVGAPFLETRDSQRCFGLHGGEVLTPRPSEQHMTAWEQRLTGVGAERQR
jgi:hypothetical protein